MCNLVKVQFTLTVILLTFYDAEIVNSELIPKDLEDFSNGKFVVIKNESYIGENVNKSKFIVTNDNFDKQSEDFSQFEAAYPSEFGSFDQEQEQDQFPISAPELKNESTIYTKTYTFFSNNSNSIQHSSNLTQNEQSANYELVEPQQDVDALSFTTQYYYRSIFIGNFDYFNEHWTGISTGNPTGYGAIAVKLSFAFPFYDRYVTDITIHSKGFIQLGQHVQNKDVTTQYIAPLMANFDVLTTLDSIVYYDDGEKFTVLWENVHLEGDEDNLFFFGVTLYKNGDIVFSYKYIPLTVKSIYEKDKNFKIGISDTYVKENVFDDYRQLVFNNYDITSNTMLWLAILPPVINAVPQEGKTVAEGFKNFDDIKDLALNKPMVPEEKPIVSKTSEININEDPFIEDQRTTEEQDIVPEVTTETAAPLPDEKIEAFPEAGKINAAIDETKKTELSIVRALFDDNLDSRKVDVLEKTKFNDNIKTQLDTGNLKYENHSLYHSLFIGDSVYFNNYWKNITKSKPLRNSHRNSHRSENTVRLTFDFPFYDRIIRSIKISNDGFIDLDDKTTDIKKNVHYIAPLMSNFETKTESQILIKNYEDNEKFTTVWDGVTLGDEKREMFTFAVTLYRNGDIVFAYKAIPIPIAQVFDSYEQTKIGISDSNEENRQISFKYYDIKSSTILKILATGNMYTNKTSPLLVRVQPQTTTTAKTETSHRRFEVNRNKLTTATVKVTENTQAVTQNSTKITDEIQKIPETKLKISNSRRKITDIKQKTSDNSSDLYITNNKEEINQQQTTLKDTLGNETKIPSTFMERSDTKEDLENVQHLGNDNYYQSLLSNNVITFEDHWANITNQKPLKLPGRSNSRRTDISQTLTFDFPFYNRNLRNIMITTDGFINVGEGSHGLESRQYIAPLMANFDKKSIRQNQIKVYDDGSKFTALWENVRLQNDKTKIFTFAATMYIDGEIIFAYRNMPISIKAISEIDPQVKVGISDIFIENGSIVDSKRQISFTSNDITEDSILKLRTKRSCQHEKCDNENKSDFDREQQSSIDFTTNNPLLNTVHNDTKSFSKSIEATLNLETTTKLDNVQSTLRILQNQESSTTESIKNVNIMGYTQKDTEVIDKESEVNRTLVKITGVPGKISGIKYQGLNKTTNTNSVQMSVDQKRLQENQSLSLFEQNSNTYNARDDTEGDLSITQNAKLIEADKDINNLNYKYHVFYRSFFIANTDYFNEHWESIKISKPLRQAGRSNTRRSDTVVKLNFDFPFYGRTLRTITVANEGFIAISDRLDQELPFIQYIAPLMLNFTNKANSQSSIKLYQDVDKFTALWENLYLQEDKSNKFTFAVTLFKNGDIIFAYKNIPTSIQEIQSRGYNIQIGVNNEVLGENNPQNNISFTSYNIISNSLIKILTLTGCKTGNCESLNEGAVDSIELLTTQDPTLEKKTQTKNMFESTTASVYQTTAIEVELTPNVIKSEINSKNRRPLGFKSKDVPLKISTTTTTNKAITDDLSGENKTLESENSTLYKVIVSNDKEFSENNLLSNENSLESIRAESDVDNLHYINHQFYKSAFIGNVAYFNNHWEDIFKSKQIKLAARGNTRRSDINAKIAFGFPFYNQTIRNIKVSVDGFIDTGYKVDKKPEATWYISPFMTTFDSKTNSNSIKLYQDSEKFTAIWENVHFVEDTSTRFTFAVTLYQNGDIIFAYKDIPVRLNTTSEKEHSIKVGIHYLQTSGKDLEDDKRVVLFNNYNISSETLLKLTIISNCQDKNNCDKLRQDITEAPAKTNTQIKGIAYFASSKNNVTTRGKYIVDDPNKNIENSREVLEDKSETKELRSKTNIVDSGPNISPLKEKPYEQSVLFESNQIGTIQPSKKEQNASDINKIVSPVSVSEANISTKAKLPGARRKIIGTKTKITPDMSTTTNPTVDDIIQKPLISDNETRSKPDVDSDKSKKNYKVVKAEKNIKNLNSINHGLYRSTFIGDVPYFEEHWKNITSSKLLRQAGRSNSRRSDTIVKLTFDFPYFGHVIRNILVTNEGLINIGDTLQHGHTYSQYIAPLKAPFDNKSTNKSKVKLYDDGEKFTTIWENVYLQEDISKTFTFAVTLYSNGNIIFAYKDVPDTINEILGGDHEVQIGITDDQSSDVAKQYRHISFNSYEISNNTLLKLISLQTCEQDDSCGSLVEDSITDVSSIEPTEAPTNPNHILKRLNLLQKQPLISTLKSEEEAFSATTKIPEDNSRESESFPTISTTVSTGIKSRLIENRRRIGAFKLDSKSVSNKTVSEHKITTEKVTQNIIIDEQNSDTQLNDTTTSSETIKSSTNINAFKRKIPGRKDKNTGDIVTNSKLDKTIIKSENDVSTEVPRIIQSTDIRNNTERDFVNVSELENIGASGIEGVIEAERNVSNLHYVTRGYYKSAFFVDPLYFNEHWNAITKTKPVKQPGRGNTRRSSIKLSFDFPYYSHMIRNITVADQGGIIISNGDDAANAFTLHQYISPFMMNFDSKVTAQSSIKLYDENDKFTVIWEKLRLQDDRTKTFTFAVTLYKNGDILFAYKDIPLSIQSIGDKNKLKIGLSAYTPNDTESTEISLLSYKIVSGSIIKMTLDPSTNPTPVETPMQINLSTSRTSSFDKNLSNNSDININISEIDFNTSTEEVSSLINTVKESNSSKIKLIGNKPKSFNSLSKISYSRPKIITSANEEEVADKKTISSADSSISKSIDINEDQESEKDTFDKETKKIFVTTVLPQSNIRLPKINASTLRTVNSIKFRKPSFKIDSSTPVTLNEVINEKNISQKQKEDSDPQQPISDSSLLSEIQDDEPESQQDLESQTLAYPEQVTPNPESSSKSAISGYKGFNRRLTVTSNSLSSQKSALKNSGYSEGKFRSKIKSRIQEITGITQSLNTVTESQLQQSEYLKESDFNQERSAVKLEQKSTNKTLISKIPGSKFKVNTVRPRPFGKLKQSIDTKSDEKESAELTSSKSLESLIDQKSNKTIEVSRLIKAEMDIDSLSYTNYESYKSTFFSDSAYFRKYWEEITSTNFILQDSEKSFTTISLSFDFPFYGRILRDFTITGKGFIDISGKYDEVQSTHYIAPLMGNFESNNQQPVKIFNDTDKLTVLWENLYFIQDKSKTFTFALTLYKNGDIIFAYKDFKMSLSQIYDLDPKAYVGIRDGAESKQISFKYYDITSDSILKLINTDRNANVTEMPGRPTTISSLALSIKDRKIAETNTVPKDAENSAENTFKINGRRKLTGKSYQLTSYTSKAVISNDSYNESSSPHEIAKSEIVLPDVTSENPEGRDKTASDSPEVALESMLKIPTRRKISAKSFKGVQKTVILNGKAFETEPGKGDLKTKTVNFEVTPESFENKENTPVQNSSSFVQNTFTRKVTSRRILAGQRPVSQIASSTTKRISQDDDIKPITEASPESYEVVKSEKIPSDITPEKIEPVVKSGEESSVLFVKNNIKTTGRRRLSGTRYQINTASKFTLPSIQAKLDIPTIERNQEVSETEKITSELLPEPLETVVNAHKTTEERGESSTAAESPVELPISEQVAVTGSKISADSVKSWVIRQRPRRIRQKLVL